MRHYVDPLTIWKYKAIDDNNMFYVFIFDSILNVLIVAFYHFQVCVSLCTEALLKKKQEKCGTKDKLVTGPMGAFLPVALS